MRTARPLHLTAAALALALAATGCASKATSTGTATTAGASATTSGAGGATTAAAGGDTAAAALPAAIKAKGVLTIATDPSYAPIESFKAGTKDIVGLDPDLANALGAVLGVKVQLQAATFDGIVASLASGRYDLAMSAMSDTKDRQAKVDFVDYFTAGTSIMVAAGNPKGIKSMDDLCGLNVAAENGTVQLMTEVPAQTKKCKAAGKPAVNLSGFPDQNGAVLALRSGRVQAVLSDSPVNSFSVQQSGGKFESVPGVLLDSGPYGIAVSKKDVGLLKAVQLAMQELVKSGKYDAILKQWNLTDGAVKTAAINGGS